MPVARIVSRNLAPGSGPLHFLTERLRAAGYEVEVAPPGSGAGDADLLIELDQLPPYQAFDAAVQIARESGCDLFVAPGLIAESSSVPDAEGQLAPAAAAPSNAVTEPVAEHSAAAPAGVVVGETLGQVNEALTDTRERLRDAVSGARTRLTSAWDQFQQRRAAAAKEGRLERERRFLQREERRRQHELELQRQAEERQLLLAERERVTAEREQVLRQQMAREAALRAERERVERETMAHEAARRAEAAHAAEQERRRLAALEAERLRVLREQEAQRAAALAAEQVRLQQESVLQHAAALSAGSEASRLPQDAMSEPLLDAAPVLRPRLLRPQRRIPSPRERQWQRAALVASIATLAAMIGYALAANRTPASPMPKSLLQNSAEQQVPFGPARMNVSSVSKTPIATPQPGALATRPQAARPAAQVEKRSAAKSVPRRSARHTRRDAGVAEDEVIVRHAPTPRNQSAQTTSGVRRYSDDN